jgi:hypothetical protein
MYFIINGIDNKTSAMKEIGREDSGWIILYQDTNNVIWKYIIIDDRSFITLLMRNDIPNKLSELFKSVFKSEETEDQKGLALLCSTGLYNYSEIADYLENNRNEIGITKMNIFISNFRPRDNRKIINMNYSDIQSSYISFKESIQRIMKLRTM